GTTNGVIRGGTLDFQTGTLWTIEGGSSAVSVGQEFLLAESTASSLTNGLLVDDVTYNGSGANWLEGISALTNDAVSLYAIYGDRELDATFQDAGIDPDSELGKVVSNLSGIITNKESAQWAAIKDLGATAEEVAVVLADTYTRTPEIASSLTGLQSVFADQITDRTRSRLRLSNWSGATASLPQGAAGPSDWFGNTVDWIQDHLPAWDGRKALRDASENAPGLKLSGDEPDVSKAYISGSAGKGGSYDVMKDKVDELLPRASGRIIEIPTTYQVWGRGYGASLDQKSTTGHSGYEARVAGGILGVDKRIDNLLVGVGGGYARTDLQGNSGQDGTVETGHAVGYFSAMREQFYFDVNLNYAFNDVETESNPSLGYTSKYDAHTLGFYLGGGMGVSFWNDALLFTPNASLLSTLYRRQGYVEKSSMGMPDKDYDFYDQWSYLGSLGASLSMLGKIESFDLEMEFQPELRLHWLHEFNADPDNESYHLVGGAGTVDVGLQAREEDLVKVGAGMQFSKWGSDTTEFGLDFDYTLGQDYSAYIVSGRIMHRF
ncbi:MAG: autotransporter outer membrane beta-barrel domain-containing protein, partial [Pontiella sp.]|nr:autotransporter outer membrane beta-barrel domain-containing protein [Pontiella sp.]